MSHPLPPEDQRHLETAQGWLELENHLEANEELERIAPGRRTHPDVLDLRWEIYSRAENWEMCETIARTLKEMIPSQPKPWNRLAFSLHMLGRTQEAYMVLAKSAPAFLKDCAITYSLAVYGCQLGMLDRARVWLAMALDNAPEPAKLKLLAMDDPELEALWQ